MKKGIGPLGLDLTPLLRSLPSVYHLLPIYPCVEVDGGGELQRVAAAAGSGALPHVQPDRAADARAFHQQIEDAQKVNATQEAYRERGYKLLPVVGIEQPTYQSARAAGGTVELLRSHGGQDLGGDGTVPRVSGTPIELSDAEAEVYAAEMHGSLQNADGPLANIHGVLTRANFDLASFRAELPTALTLDLDDAVLPGEPLVVRARTSEGNPVIRAQLTHLGSGQQLTETLGRAREPGWQTAELDLAPGAWRVRIEADGASPVTDLAVVSQA